MHRLLSVSLRLQDAIPRNDVLLLSRHPERRQQLVIFLRHPERRQPRGSELHYVTCMSVGIYRCLSALQGERVSARAVDKGRLIRIRGFSPPRQGRGCLQTMLLSLSAALPRHCIDRCRYHQGLTMQFLAMTFYSYLVIPSEGNREARSCITSHA